MTFQMKIKLIPSCEVFHIAPYQNEVFGTLLLFDEIDKADRNQIVAALENTYFEFSFKNLNQIVRQFFIYLFYIDKYSGNPCAMSSFRDLACLYGG